MAHVVVGMDILGRKHIIMTYQKELLSELSIILHDGEITDTEAKYIRAVWSTLQDDGQKELEAILHEYGISPPATPFKDLKDEVLAVFERAFLSSPQKRRRTIFFMILMPVVIVCIEFLTSR